MKRWTDGPIGDLILYKDNQLLVLNKPAGLPVQPDPSGDKALLDLAEIYAKHPLHLVHRIDRPVSGLVLLAKNARAMSELSRQFRERTVTKRYLAVVGVKPDPLEGRLTHRLRVDRRANRTVATASPAGETEGSTLSYRFLSSIDRYHLLLIDMPSGRHHQIRAQLAAAGMPIKGDVKYGFRRGNRDRSIHLHAWRLQFQHPVSHEPIALTAPLPKDTVWQAFLPLPDVSPA